MPPNVAMPIATSFKPVTKLQVQGTPTSLTNAAMDQGEAFMQQVLEAIRVYPPEISGTTRTKVTNEPIPGFGPGRPARTRMSRLGEVVVESYKFTKKGAYSRTQMLFDSWQISRMANTLTLSNNARDKWGRFYAVWVHGGFTAVLAERQTSFHRAHGWRNAYRILQSMRYTFGSQPNLRRVLRAAILNYLKTSKA
jgi:hypothetical protein